MAKCCIKRGFFVLRDCTTRADTTCSVCNRPVCPDHYKLQDGGAFICLDCFGKRKKELNQKHISTSQNKQTYKSIDDESDVYAYRHEYYGYAYYHPIYFGHDMDSYYDEYDIRSFDNRNEYDTLENEESETDILDS